MQKPRHWFVILIVIIVLIALMVYIRYSTASHSENSAENLKKNKTPSVGVVNSKQGNITITHESPGTITPLQQTVVHPMINGRITRLLFNDGDWVNSGQVLAELDDRLARQTLNQLQATLRGQQAQQKQVNAQLAQYQKLLQIQAVSQLEVAQLQSQQAQITAQMAATRAQMEAAKTNIDYMRIKAPFTGRMGFRKASVGSYVTTTDASGIGTLTQLEPIAIDFGISTELASPQSLKGKSVRIEDLNSGDLITSGTVKTIDSQMDSATGQLKVRAQFANSDHSLIASQPVRVVWPVKTYENAVYVPLVAVQQGLKDRFVYTVDSQDRVQHTTITWVDQTDRDAIVEGLQPDVPVVVDGFGRLKNGQKVKPRSESKLDKQFKSSGQQSSGSSGQSS